MTGALITSPGFYPEIAPVEYFAEPCPAPALTNSGIGLLIESCPAKFYAFQMQGASGKSTAAQYLGSLVHRLALDKGAEYAVIDADSYRTKEAKVARAEAEAEGLIPVLIEKLGEAKTMAAVVRERIAEAVDGEPYQTEVVIAWQRRGRWCRAMLDVWCPTRLLALDVKTCADAGDLAIRRAFGRGYGRQDAWYTDGLHRLTGEYGRIQFGFLFVETEPPFLGRSAFATGGMRHGSNMECDRAFEIFDRCMTADAWPGYAPISVEPAPWQARDWAEAELEEAA